MTSDLPQEMVETLNDLQAIRNVAGDLEHGIVGSRIRGNIGGIVTRACDRLEEFLLAANIPALLAERDELRERVKGMEKVLNNLVVKIEDGDRIGNLGLQEAYAVLAPMDGDQPPQEQASKEGVRQR